MLHSMRGLSITKVSSRWRTRPSIVSWIPLMSWNYLWVNPKEMLKKRHRPSTTSKQSMSRSKTGINCMTRRRKLNLCMKISGTSKSQSLPEKESNRVAATPIQTSFTSRTSPTTRMLSVTSSTNPKAKANLNQCLAILSTTISSAARASSRSNSSYLAMLIRTVYEKGNNSN